MTALNTTNEVAADKRPDPPVDARVLRRLLHDMSNLLTGIMVHGGLLVRAINEQHRMHRYALEVCEGGERASALVRQMRSMLLSPDETLQEGLSPNQRCDLLANECDVDASGAAVNQPQ